MTKDEALRLAEEAILDELEAVTDEEFEDAAGKLDDALRAIRKALDQPTVRDNLIVEAIECNQCHYKRGFVEWADKTKWVQDTAQDNEVGMHRADVLQKRIEALTTVKPVKHADWCASLTQVLMSYPPQPAACNCQTKPVEPVAWAYMDADGSFMDALDRKHGAYQTPLYTSPQPRHDVDLTDSEIFDIAEEFGEFKYGDAQGDKRLGFARAVEAKIKEKRNENRK